MNKRFYIGLVLALVAGAFVAGCWYARQRAPSSASSDGRRILYYVDPMNPSHTSDKPGFAPCGMKLEPVYAEGGTQHADEGSMEMSPGTVKISPERQQAIGVRMAEVEKSSPTYTIRALGRVVAD